MAESAENKRALKDIEELERKAERLKDVVSSLEVQVAALEIHVAAARARLTAIDGVVGWIVKLIIAAIIGGFMTFLLRGGLVS
tara:strand:+ start:1563 stop:1811 length:249 start_codon:yes stop_codon:yes gene_type:complete